MAVGIPESFRCRPVTAPVLGRGDARCEPWGWGGDGGHLRVASRDRYAPWHHPPGARVAFKEKAVHLPGHGTMLALVTPTCNNSMTPTWVGMRPRSTRPSC